MALTWTPRANGTALPIDTSTHPGLVELRSDGSGFEQFDAEPGSFVDAPLEPFEVHLATTSNFAVYVETATSAGRRQFKFVPGARAPRLRFGYRYEISLGADVRNGSLNSTTIDLVALAALLEPGVTIDSILALFARLPDVLTIGLSINTRPTQPPPPPPPSQRISEAEAVRFLNQATFGATKADIASLTALGSYDQWITNQLALSPSLTLPYVRENGRGGLRPTRHYIWWRNVVSGADQLRQRVAFALSQIFVVADIDYSLGNAQFGMCNYYDMLATEGLGSFRTLLEQVTLHPVMGIYLSMLRNEKADTARNVRPDENYAREVLQLFTIGLNELTPNGQPRLSGGRPIPTYDQATVEEFAKVFTGWNFNGVEQWTSNDLTSYDKEAPMTPVERYHDTSAKRLLNGVTLPAGQDARTDLAAALDNIVDHANVGPFISRRLIQQLVTSNPSPAYIGRVAAAFNDDGGGARGNLSAVVRAILTDDEARRGPTLQPSSFGKIKEPIMRLSQLWRAFDATPGAEANGVHRPYFKVVDQLDDVFGQAVMRSPSVFNFFQPDHPIGPGESLVAPERQILTEIDLASTNNLLFQQLYSDNNRRVSRTNTSVINIDDEVNMAADVDRLLDHLDVLLVAGQLPVELRRDIANHLTSSHPDTDDEETLVNRVLDAVFCIIGSPFHLVQK